MMTNDQRHVAEQIADYVRREVREVGMVVDSGGLLCILTGFSVHDGKPVWRDLMDPECDAVAQEVVEQGIPDLSDDATIDALLRHLRRRGWVVARQSARSLDRCRMALRLRDMAEQRYEAAWLVAVRAINEEDR